VDVPSWMILVSAVMVLSCRQTESQTELQTRIIVILTRLSNGVMISSCGIMTLPNS